MAQEEFEWEREGGPENRFLSQKLRSEYPDEANRYR
jgi:hypothetical protein